MSVDPFGHMVSALLTREVVPVVVSPLEASPVTSPSPSPLVVLDGGARSRETPREADDGPSRRDDAAALYVHLCREIAQAQERGEPVPCLGPRSAAWTSDERQEQRYAAAGCRACPAVALCREYGDAAREPAGTWGGVTRDPARERTAAQARRLARLRGCCTCGCGGRPKRGRYLAGHDARHVGVLLREVLEGRPVRAAVGELSHSPRLRAKLLRHLAKQ